jgi:hypothetical protein
MKTHEFADALMLFARMLKAGRNVEINDWIESGSPVAAAGSDSASAEVGLSLAVMGSLSRYTKAQWRALLTDWRLPVEIRPSDSVRDLIGRVLGYLADHPDAIRRVRAESAKKSTKVSPQLQRALAILLGENGSDEADEDISTGS